MCSPSSPFPAKQARCCFGRDAEALLVNGKERAFPSNAGKFVYVKIQATADCRSRSRHEDQRVVKGIGIAMEYKSVLEVLRAKAKEERVDVVKEEQLDCAVLYEIALTEEVKDGLPVWVARIRQDRKR
ncbi:hypothetical protein NMY22_g3561 [Coprinellus aureogranulatus]|nr:hypothetical protein NMY22_g3561 [Coprinellus aureogranulatus]